MKFAKFVRNMAHNVFKRIKSGGNDYMHMKRIHTTNGHRSPFGCHKLKGDLRRNSGKRLEIRFQESPKYYVCVYPELPLILQNETEIKLCSKFSSVLLLLSCS